jgi:hypothetical protein
MRAGCQLKKFKRTAESTGKGRGQKAWCEGGQDPGKWGKTSGGGGRREGEDPQEEDTHP